MRRLALSVLLLGQVYAGALAGSSVAMAADTGASGGAAAPPLASPPRTVQVVLADIAAALASEKAWKAHKNVRMKLEMSFQGMGINGTGEHFATNEDKAVLITDLPGMGTSKQGTNGKVAWAQDPINGLRTLSGAEAEWERIESAWNPELRMSELYKSIDLVPAAGPGLECLLLTPHEAPPVTSCYDAKTHLQVSQKGTQPTPQGDTPFSSTLKDWREVGGIKMPFAVETQAGPITFTARLTEVKFDQPMSDKMFEPPGVAAATAGGEATGAKGKARAKPKAHAKKP